MVRKLRKDSDYFQPDFYHFSQDSISLAQIVLQEIPSIPKNSWFMDLCAGCGVVGLEIMKSLDQKINFDFLEIQKEFFPFFYKNLNFVGEKGDSCHFHNIDFREFPINRKYSIIVSNPPYFIPGHGRSGKDPRGNKCKFFQDGSYIELFQFLKKSLLPKGKAFILFRETQKIDSETYKDLVREFGGFFDFQKRPLDKKNYLIVLSVLDINGN
jgi:tRNA1Val (adenine37-N6)-methyltransferase